jgi:hypothetical protein
MLLIDTQERETAAEQANRLYRAQRRRQRLRDAGLFTGILAIVAGILLAVLLAPRGPLGGGGEDSDHEATAAGGSTAVAAAPTAAEAKGVKFEKFERVDPALPAIPPGAVKRFKIDVYEHVTKVSADLAPTEVWSYAINGVEHRGTGVSEPMVVEVGDRVKIDLINGSSERMNVRMPHSIDYHSSEVNPGEAFKTIPPGGKHSFEFTAKHPACSCTTARATRSCTTPGPAWSAPRSSSRRTWSRSTASCGSTSRSSTSASRAARPTCRRCRPSSPT